MEDYEDYDFDALDDYVDDDPDPEVGFDWSYDGPPIAGSYGPLWVDRLNQE